jgi:trehalose 6-phosphate synthase
VNIFRLQLRFLIPFVVTLLTAAALAFHAFDVLTEQWFTKDMHLRSRLATTALSESVSSAFEHNQMASLSELFTRATQEERLTAIGLCNPEDDLLLTTGSYPEGLSCQLAREISHLPLPYFHAKSVVLHVSSESVKLRSGLKAHVVMLHDRAYVERRKAQATWYLIAFLLLLGLVIAAIVAITTQMSIRALMKGIRTIVRGEEFSLEDKTHASRAFSSEIAADVRARLRELEDDYRRIHDANDTWTADHLRSLLRTQLRGEQVIVLSNREPWVHEWENGSITTYQPASGLVTALEPVVAACAGTWIAHGCGSADREVTDAEDSIALPPQAPSYRLRRIWLSDEEVDAYYDKMSNQGLWPLSHLAHVQPEFDEKSWQTYVTVNQKFADAALAEARIPDPVILVQDYHLALVPQMIRAKLPAATIISFWHIPWPNPESFLICPWRHEILRGLLGSSILGFQTSHYRRNFIDSVDRLLETRIDHEHSKILFNGNETLIESYPASIAWPSEETSASERNAEILRLRASYGLAEECRIIVGVDRFDYTKGIPERLCAFEHLLEQSPDWIGKLVFLQVAAPSREHIQDYQSLRQRVGQQVAAINKRFGQEGRPAIILLDRFHSHAEINSLYRAADICIVSSLHDGMNLVCKEFIAARDDEQGVLLLSQFTGAARELPEALGINPYHIEGMVSALRQALNMPKSEQKERMASMRNTIREANVFRWAGRMLGDASHQRLRLRIAQRVQASHTGQ